jgi:hypothetical protein
VSGGSPFLSAGSPNVVNGAGSVCDQKTSKFFVLCGGISGRTHGYKGSLLKGKGNTKGSLVGRWWSLLAESASLSQVLLKFTLIYGKGGTR